MNTKAIESTFQFVGHTIESLTMKNTFAAFDSEMNLERNFDVVYSDIETDVDEEYIFGKIRLHVFCDIKEKANVPTDNEKSNEYSLSLSIDGCFVDNKDVSKKDFIEKLKVNGCASLYSIARAIITGISAQSLLSGQITLPMINVFHMLKK